MEPGSFEVEFSRDPILEDEMVAGRHLRFYQDGELVYSGVILLVDRRRAKVFVTGRGPSWWLGAAERGPVIDFLRLCAATNRLSNGAFELGENYWRLAQDSLWSVGEEGIGEVGSAGARTTGSYPKEDRLSSAEDFEAFPGDVMIATVRARDTGAASVLRLRVIYGGRINHPNLLADPSFENFGAWTTSIDPEGNAVDGDSGGVVFSAQARTGNKLLRLGPIPKSQYIENPGFETGDLSGWDYVPSNGNVDVVSGSQHSGSYRCRLLPGGFDTPGVWQDFFGPEASDQLRFRVYTNPGGPVEQLQFQVNWYEGGEFQTDIIHESPGWGGEYHRWSEYWTVPDDHDSGTPIRVTLAVDLVMSGTATWSVDDCIVERVKGNQRYMEQRRDTLPSFDGFPVIPERTYRCGTWVRSAPEVRNGEVWLQIVTTNSNTGAVELYETQHQASTDDSWVFISLDVTPTSGFDTMRFAVWGQDIFGGPFYVDDAQCIDTDPSSLTVEGRAYPGFGGGGFATRALTSVVPDGADTMRYELAADRDVDGGWTVDTCVLRRDCVPADAATVVALLAFTPPAFFGSEQILLGGLIEAAGPILFDLTVRNMTHRRLLDEISRSGMVLPQREWRVNPDFTLDWGLPSSIFVDRTGVLLVEDDVWVRGEPRCADDSEEFCTRARVIGAERRTLHEGAPILVRGEATNSAGARRFPAGGVMSRTHLVEDSGVDHAAYATDLAAQIAAQDAAPARLLDLEVNNWDTLGAFDVGDWIYPWLPVAGCEDPANPVPYRDGEAYPIRLRVLERTRRLGEGSFECYLRREDGTELDVSAFALWEEVTTGSLQVGDPVPDFIRNEQAGAVTKQYLRFRGRLADG